MMMSKSMLKVMMMAKLSIVILARSFTSDDGNYIDDGDNDQVFVDLLIKDDFN
jgi:hypothetical protein